MDFSPRQVMALVRADFKHEVLSRKTVWLCASGYACTVECLRQIRITDIMYALKQRAIKEGIYPKRFPIALLAKEFSEMVRSKGRITETLLVMRLFLKGNWRAVFSSWRPGLGLIRTGRFVARHERIERRVEMAAMLAAADNDNPDQSRPHEIQLFSRLLAQGLRWRETSCGCNGQRMGRICQSALRFPGRLSLY